jgi:shikimate dehydrogenase
VSDQFTRRIDATTRYCAVYGHPIQHSASPAMQNAGIAALGLHWRYLAFDVHPDDLAPAIGGAMAMKFIGLNLTVPHKLLALPMVDVLDESASTWGAVNTIRFEARDEEGNWRPLNSFTGPIPDQVRSHGFNTDADAIVQSLREDLGLQLAGTRVLVLGAGGAGRVTALKLAAEGVGELTLMNRTAKKAAALAVEIQQRFPNVKVRTGYPTNPVELLVNATSLGLKPSDELPLDEKAFPLNQAGAVYDIIYRPA